MTEQNDGGPAFPHMEETNDGRVEVTNYGMSLRDWFAGQALTGWLSGPCHGEVLEHYENWPEGFAGHQSCVARATYGYADAMLAARKAEL